MKVVLVRSNQAAQPGQPSRLLFNFFKDFFATCLSIKIHSTRLKISFSLILLVKITHRCLFVSLSERHFLARLASVFGIRLDRSRFHLLRGNGYRGNFRIWVSLRTAYQKKGNQKISNNYQSGTYNFRLKEF